MGIACISNVTEWRWGNVAEHNSTESVNLYGGVFRCRGSAFSQDVISSTHSFRSVASFCRIRAVPYVPESHVQRGKETKMQRERQGGFSSVRRSTGKTDKSKKVVTLYMKSLIK